jgi:hypothetical protein
VDYVISWRSSFAFCSLEAFKQIVMVAGKSEDGSVEQALERTKRQEPAGFCSAVWKCQLILALSQSRMLLSHCSCSIQEAVHVS